MTKFAISILKKMNIKSVFLVVVCLCVYCLAYSQNNVISNAINKQNISVNNTEIKNSNSPEKKINPFWKGWAVRFAYGLTQFNGDIRQYDYYAAYQKSVEFSELKSALSLSLIKEINPFFSLEGEFISGKFGGFNRTYSDVTITDGYYDNPYVGFHEGHGEKFETDFIEFDASLLFDISKLYSYFSKSKKKRYSLLGKIGMGYNVFNALKTNLNTNTYIYSYGYADEGKGEVKENFSESPSVTVMLYGIQAGYPINKRIDINIELTKRTARSVTWDASERKTNILTDRYTSMMFGLSYKFGSQINESEWEGPIDGLKDDVNTLFVKIDGFTEDTDNDGVSDDDKDGVPNSKDLESSTPVGALVNQFGINVSNSTYVNSGGLIFFPSIYFKSGSAVVGSSNENGIATMALLLKSNTDIKLKVIGHTDTMGNAKFNKKLGLKRANSVINYLVLNYNIEADRLIATTKGEEDPLSAVTQISNNLETGKSVNRLAEINRRVDFEIVN